MIYVLLLYVVFRFICILLPLLCWTAYLSFLEWNSSDPKEKQSFYAFIMNNKVILYCLHIMQCIALEWRHDSHNYTLQQYKQ